MGLANQLGKFSCHLAEITHPFRGLLSSKRAWLWGPEQESAFVTAKEELAKPTILALEGKPKLLQMYRLSQSFFNE